MKDIRFKIYKFKLLKYHFPFVINKAFKSSPILKAILAEKSIL